MPIIALESGRHFDAETNESLLDAGLRQGLSLAYSCRTGRCSTCKARVLGGETRALMAETGLPDSERNEGWILTCSRAASSDLKLQMEDLGDLQLPSPRTFPCRIQSIEALTANVIRLTLRLPPQTTFDYLPGQYVEIIGPGGMRRSYSIANAPELGSPLEFHIRKVDGGAMSEYWFGTAKANDLLRLFGPLGTFVLRDVAGAHLVCLATGTGLAPIKAMVEALKTLPKPKRPRKTTVYWGARLEGDHYLQLPDQPDVEFVPVLSRAGPGWGGSSGHVQDAMLSRGADLRDTIVYACGSDAMITTARSRLLEAGLSTRALRADAFVCTARP